MVPMKDQLSTGEIILREVDPGKASEAKERLEERRGKRRDSYRAEVDQVITSGYIPNQQPLFQVVSAMGSW